MIRQVDKLLADELIKKKILSQEDVQKCIKEVESSNETLRGYLIRHQLVNEQQILDALSTGLHLGTVDLSKVSIDKSVIERIPVRFASYYRFLPIKIEGKELTLVSASSLDVKIQDEIRVHLGLEPKVVLARESEVMEALEKHYGVGADTIDKITTKADKDKKEEVDVSSVWVEDLEKESQNASVAKLVNQIFLDAYKKRATDIHLEPYRDVVRLRYRIDGVLVDANLPAEARSLLRPILSRIKIMANLSIEEKRLPQDGSAIVKTKDETLDLRISTIPTPRGESMVIRILPTKVMLYSLGKLGIDRNNLKIFRNLIKKPHGIILVTGPTGSGKTTTLYACLNEISNVEKKIVTIEDPIEYEMEGLTQIQVNHKVNLDFARGLRSILRHDPDIIMVGEIRDIETAEIAIRTALTGHLVFSTLHTNDAASGIVRLVDMGLESFLVSSSVEAFIAQRLVRTICTGCKEEIGTPLMELREEIAESLGLKSIVDVRLYQGKGCSKCNNTGFYGRTAIYEILTVTEEIRAAILEKRRSEEIKEIAMRSGMRSLRQDGWYKVIQGITTSQEIMEVTAKDKVNYFKDEPIAMQKTAGVSKQAMNVQQEKGGTQKKIQIQDTAVLESKNEYDTRIYERLLVKLDLRFQIIQPDPEDPNSFVTDEIEHATYTKDISAGGVRFSFGKPLAVGTLLSLKIQLNEKERSIDCMAKVCRVEDDDLSGRNNVVVYYLDITSADRVKVDNYVKERLE